MKIILLSAGLSLFLSLILTRLVIGFMVGRGYGQFIRDDGPSSHHVKRGTPTAGGVAIIASVILAYLISHLVFWQPPTVSGLLVLYVFFGTGLLGFLDDWIKISHHRSLGLRAWEKLAGQTAIGVSFAVGSLLFSDIRGNAPASLAISFFRDIPWLTLPAWLAVIWIMFIISAWSNAVNLTDGLDGLATGICSVVFLAYAVINIWQKNQSCAAFTSNVLKCYEVRDPYDLAIIAISISAACFGFLWWNAKPAKIFMGDVGALSLGSAFAAMTIFTRTEFLGVLIGGLFVVILMSVVLQAGFFKITRGKRIFRMAPLQHHFELKGWDEATIVIRFWIIAGVFVVIASGIFYGEWVSGL